MKAITLTPPWGTLIAIAARWPELGKHFETRSWPLPVRYLGQPLAIHQAKGLADLKTEAALAELCASEPFRPSLTAAGITEAGQLPRGAIVAIVTPRQCYRVEGGVMRDFYTRAHAPLPGEPERSFGGYGRGRYAWHLDAIRALATPVPCRGAQGLWDVPAAAARRCVVQP